MKHAAKRIFSLLLAALLLGSGSCPALADGTLPDFMEKIGKTNRITESEDPLPAEKVAWTVFVYLCGTNLESEGTFLTACGSYNLRQMKLASTGDQVRFVIQTGGAQKWHTQGIDADKCQRFIIQKGKMTKVWEGRRTSMGSSDTLADFLIWGVSNFPSEKTALILWNHGGGSITGVCFDELERGDSLSLREIDTALESVSSLLPGGFELIGFDACLMGTLETANILAPYARYMVASEETVLGTGMDYKHLGSFLRNHPEADGAALGREICDSYFGVLEEDEDTGEITMSVVDLRAVDPLIEAFDRFAQSVSEKGEDSAVRAMMVRSIVGAENFGGNNRAEGYTNMVDLAGLILACAPWADHWEEALDAIDSAVIYRRNGEDHRDASGLALYYPLEVRGSREISVFSDICPSPGYVSFVKSLTRSNAGQNGGTGSFWEKIESILGNTAGEDEIPGEEDYWDYLDDLEVTGESPRITFETEPHLDEDGSFFFVLDENGLENTESVTALIYQISEDGEDVIELGETTDVEADWDSGTFRDMFDGYWLSLPDGQNLAIYPVYETEHDLIFSSPVLLNGEETNLRIRQSRLTGNATADGTWAGIDEEGYADRGVVRLKTGDEIIPLYNSYLGEEMEDGYYTGWEYSVRKPLKIRYELMESGDYLYAFCINDLYGDYYLTDFTMFNVDEDGEVYFYED